MASMSVTNRGQWSGRADFPLLQHQRMIPVRVMTDLGSVEVFAADGRGVYSAGLSYDACQSTECVATVSSTSTAKVGDVAELSFAAWKMLSIFA